MRRISEIALTAFGLGFMTALATMSGCSEAASRTLTIFQLQTTKTYAGPFRIDTSQLPPNAVKSQKHTGDPGKSESHLTLNQDYEFEVVLRLAD